MKAPTIEELADETSKLMIEAMGAGVPALLPTLIDVGATLSTLPAEHWAELPDETPLRVIIVLGCIQVRNPEIIQGLREGTLSMEDFINGNMSEFGKKSDLKSASEMLGFDA